jgi:hypothetical protein
VANNGSYTGNKDNYLGHTNHLSSQNWQYPLKNVNNEYTDTRFWSQLMISVAGSHVPVTQVPDIAGPQ